MSGYVGTSHVYQGSSGNTVIPLPAGSVAGGLAVLVGGTSGSGTHPWTGPTGWTNWLLGVGHNEYVGVWSKVLDAGDITAGSITYSATLGGYDSWLTTYDTTYSGIDAAASAPLTSGEYGTHADVSTATITAPGWTPVLACDMAIFATERSTATGTTVTPGDGAVVDHFEEDTNIMSSFWCGRKTGIAAGTASGTVTLTYNAATANGLIFMLPLALTDQPATTQPWWIADGAGGGIPAIMQVAS